MFFTNLFNLKRACQHDKIAPNLDLSYCPDCGKLIRNDWYITRCACCGVKLKTVVKNGEIVPQNHYCVNCGSNEYNIEHIEKINFIDINFAVLQRNEVESLSKIKTTQCWEEKISEQPKLLVQYL